MKKERKKLEKLFEKFTKDVQKIYPSTMVYSSIHCLPKELFNLPDDYVQACNTQIESKDKLHYCLTNTKANLSLFGVSKYLKIKNK